jgi:hypothetical protein
MTDDIIDAATKPQDLSLSALVDAAANKILVMLRSMESENGARHEQLLQAISALSQQLQFLEARILGKSIEHRTTELKRGRR